MTTYNNFIGIDIGKDNFVVNVLGQNTTKAYDNNPSGIALFLQEHARELAKGLCIFKSTGGYEGVLVSTLYAEKMALHRANTRQVKSFIRSLGNAAKTDALDSKALALYGCERHRKLALCKPKTAQDIKFDELTERRNYLVERAVAEQNKLQAPGHQHVKQSYEAVLEVLEKQIALIEVELKELTEGR